VGWDLMDLLLKAFVERKARWRALRQSISVVPWADRQFLLYTSGRAAGAQAFSSFDTLLAPFVHYDKLSYEM
jgi:ribonucleoside-triphosphate reductase